MFRALLVATFLTTAVAEELVLHVAPELPDGWAPSHDVALVNERLTLRFSLREQNLDKLRKIAMRVSDPRSDMYGKHLSTAEIYNLTRPSVADATIFRQWLGAHDVPFVTKGSNGFEVSLTTEKAQTLLKTEFSRASNDVTKQKVVRASDYWLPAGVDAVVAAVYGVHGLPLPPRTALGTPPTTPASVTPSVLAKTYNVSGVTPSGSMKNRQAVAEFEGQTMSVSDLNTFFDKYVPDSKASTVYKFVGDKDSVHHTGGTGTVGVEASLDIDYIMGVAPGLLTEFWYWGSTDFCGDLLTWTDGILSSKDPPLVHSVSYGVQGDLSKIGCKQANVNDIDSNFAKLAARGITIIFASGDSGSGYDPSSTCGDPATHANGVAAEGETIKVNRKDSIDVPLNDFSMCCQAARAFSRGKNVSWTLVPKDSSLSTCTIYKSVTSTRKQSGAVSGGDAFPQHTPKKVKVYPSWPASSPWVTAVGATRFVENKVGNAEMATDQFGSGGGFSEMFEAFDDQVAAVQHYLKTVPASKLPPAGSYPPGGRATPDVALLGEGYQVVAGGKVQGVGGTSASAPAFAGFVSLLNEVRTRAGKPAMGYLNPFLYQNAAAFRDVTVGTNAIGRGTGPLTYGYPCAPGWDPATGLGTPNFEKLLRIAMSAVRVEEEVIV